MRPVHQQGGAGYPEHDHRACHRRRCSDYVQVGAGKQAGGRPGPEGAHRKAKQCGDERCQDAYVLPGQGQDVGATGLAEVLGDRTVQIVANACDQGLQERARGAASPVQHVDHGRSDAPARPLQRRRSREHRNVAAVDKGGRGSERIGPRISTTTGRRSRSMERDRYDLAAHQRCRHGTTDIQEQRSARRHERAITAMYGKELDRDAGQAGGGPAGIGSNAAIIGYGACRSDQARGGSAGDRLDAGMGAASGKESERQGDQEAMARAGFQGGEGGHHSQQGGSDRDRDDAGGRARLQVYRDGRSDGEWNRRCEVWIRSGHDA